MVPCALIAGLFAAVAGVARADEPPRIEIAVGETAERAVGFALGLRCDDPSIVRAELEPASPDSNVFRATGLAPGTTTCRVGTAPSRPSFVFEIRVAASQQH
jgi:hypothetical protein